MSGSVKAVVGWEGVRGHGTALPCALDREQISRSWRSSHLWVLLLLSDTPVSAQDGETFLPHHPSASQAFTLKLPYGHTAQCLEADAECNNLFPAEYRGNQGLGIFW